MKETKTVKLSELDPEAYVISRNEHFMTAAELGERIEDYAYSDSTCRTVDFFTTEPRVYTPSVQRMIDLILDEDYNSDEITGYLVDDIKDWLAPHAEELQSIINKSLEGKSRTMHYSTGIRIEMDAPPVKRAEVVKCPRCEIGEMELLNNGGAEDYESWVECTDCGFVDDDSKPEYATLHFRNGFDGDEFEKWIAKREKA